MIKNFLVMLSFVLLAPISTIVYGNDQMSKYFFSNIPTDTKMVLDAKIIAIPKVTQKVGRIGVPGVDEMPLPGVGPIIGPIGPSCMCGPGVGGN